MTRINTTVAVTNGPLPTRERTGPQVGVLTGAVMSGDPVLQKVLNPSVYKTYRKMRKDPTIALARWLAVAPIVKSGWKVEETDDAPDGAKEFIEDVMQPMRIHYLRTVLYGCIDFGWQAYEKVFALEKGMVVLRKLKPLLQDITEVLIDKQTGAFNGLRQPDPTGGTDTVVLDVPECLHVVIDYEGTNWYGDAVMENVREPYLSAQTVECAADRYDEKIAGAHWVIYYPIGYSDVKGVRTDNHEVAKQVLSTLQASGAVILPSTMADVLEGAENRDVWKVELLTDSGTGAVGFVDRFKYLDVLKVRGFGLPERSVLEGRFGTKAEAESHGDFAITNMELRHDIVVQALNWHGVNQLLRFNWGPDAENTVYINPSPIDDATKRYIRQIYTAWMQNPEIALSEHDNTDAEQVRDMLQIPSGQPENVLLLPSSRVQEGAEGPPVQGPPTIPIE